MDFLLNLAIFIITLVIAISFFRENGAWNLARARKAFRFFTTQSNVLCAVASLCVCVFGITQWTYIFKYIGTVAVTVTMLTVILFLGPSLGSYKPLYKGSDLWLHLINPLLALISFCVFEMHRLSLGIAALGILPVVIYGTIYLYKILYAPENKRWDDFYGYNKTGKWPISYALMIIGTAIICLILFVVSNLVSSATEKDLYGGILQKYISGEEMFSDEGEGYDYSQAKAPGYALYDIDKDGTKELFVTPRMDDEWHTYVVYYVKDGEVTRGMALNGYLADKGYWTYFFDFFIDAYEFTGANEGFSHIWEFDYPWVDGYTANTLTMEGEESKEISDTELNELLAEYVTEPDDIQWIELK